LNSDEIHESVVRIFEEARQLKGSAYEEERFLAFLTDKPSSNGKHHEDSFNGCRRFWRFMNAAQLEFGVCFTTEEWDRSYSLSQFIAVVEEKTANAERGSQLARKRLREALVERKDRTVIWGLAVAVPLGIAALFVGKAITAFLGLVWVGACAGVYYYQTRQVGYARRLLQRIEDVVG
jgi:hypothetical protein